MGGGRRYIPRRPQSRRQWQGFGVAIVILLALVFGGSYCYAYAHEREATVVVVDKDRICDRDSNGHADCKYVVYTDKTTYRITDYIGRVTSSDAYGRIIVCHRYHITYYGFRNGFTSSYPNIKQADDLGKVEGCEPRR